MPLLFHRLDVELGNGPQRQMRLDSALGHDRAFTSALVHQGEHQSLNHGTGFLLPARIVARRRQHRIHQVDDVGFLSNTKRVDGIGLPSAFVVLQQFLRPRAAPGDEVHHPNVVFTAKAPGQGHDRRGHIILGLAIRIDQALSIAQLA
ncbi:hypothetical protein PSTA9_02087 [Pseudomonas syringae pv. tomato]|nr:hypothetical protein PSTA9_02087 [Pseudomonas syringae pv. tomato]